MDNDAVREHLAQFELEPEFIESLLVPPHVLVSVDPKPEQPVATATGWAMSLEDLEEQGRGTGGGAQHS